MNYKYKTPYLFKAVIPYSIKFQSTLNQPLLLKLLIPLTAIIYFLKQFKKMITAFNNDLKVAVIQLARPFHPCNGY